MKLPLKTIIILTIIFLVSFTVFITLGVLAFTLDESVTKEYLGTTWEFKSEVPIPKDTKRFIQKVYFDECDLVFRADLDSSVYKERKASLHFAIQTHGLNLTRNMTIKMMARSSGRKGGQDTTIKTSLDGEEIDFIGANAGFTDERLIHELVFPNENMTRGELNFQIEFSPGSLKKPTLSEFEVRIINDEEICGRSMIDSSKKWIALAIFVGIAIGIFIFYKFYMEGNLYIL